MVGSRVNGKITCIKYGDDFGGTLVGRRPESNDRLSLVIFAHRSARDEVDLAPEAREHPRANTIGADLSGDIDFYAGVDGSHLWLFGNDSRIIHVVNSQHFCKVMVLY